jgi:multiple sugar transport system permease protein
VAATAQMTRSDRPARRRRPTWRKVFGTTRDKLLELAVLLFIVFPIFWVALTSFKPLNEIYTTHIVVPLTLDNYRTIFSETMQYQRLALNSLIVSSATVLIAIPLGLAAAYVFARFHFRGATVLLIAVLVTQFIPPLVIIIPFFTLFKGIGLSDSRLALVIVYLSIVLPYSIWMLRGFIDALPVEVEEAAAVDGCNEIGTLRHITLPLVAPGIITTLIFAFILCWNEFTFALILTGHDSRMLQMGLFATAGNRGILLEQMTATGMIVMVPMFILSFLIRRYFIEGLTMGAVK